MDKSKNKTFLVFKGIKCLLKWIRRYVFIIMAAVWIGLSNAYYDECRMINDTRNFDEQEQLVDDDTDKKNNPKFQILDEEVNVIKELTED